MKTRRRWKKTMAKIIKTYSELIRLSTFEDRYRYLAMHGTVGKDTFGADRYFNQKFYRSSEWKRIRNYVIVRDNGCDLGIEGRDILGKVIIHHMNPFTIDDMTGDDAMELLNPEYLICVSHDTHNAIHYGDESLLPEIFVERRPNDTCPWLS